MRGMVWVSVVALGLAFGGSLAAEQAQDASKLDANMKVVGPANGGVRKGLESGALDAVQQSAMAMSKAFVDTEAFFKSHGKADGVEWSQGAKKAADALAATKDIDAAKAAAAEVGKFCQGCHAKYREKAADGSYTYKPGN